MTVEEFAKDFEERLSNFSKNMNNLSASQDRSEFEWMEIFLRWCEWSDDEMREQYWSKE